MSLYDNLKIAILPLDIAQEEKSKNFEAIERALRELPEGTDVLVLPELFSTGYISVKQEASKLAEGNDGDTITTLKQISQAYKIAICGSFLAKDGERLYNRGFVIEPNGEATYYDKRHLFCISAESEVCEHGTKLPPVVRYRGWNISIAVCYDLRFPAWLRNYANKYDVLILPANWPEKREYAWSHLLEARAIENEAYMVGANRSGEDRFGTYDGMSHIYDYMGKPIGLPSGPYIIASLSREALHKYRDNFPAWKDADDFTIKR